jgi:hypothetical protein
MNRLVISGVLAALLPAFNSCQVAAQHDSALAAGWDRDGAAKYLDDRMDLWFTKSKKLRTGESETSCVSCHTTIPYVLARPALRRLMRVNNATPQEMRIFEETKRRVESYKDHEPLYDFDENKKIQSRGTEAVLNALILASADAAHSPGPRPGKLSEPTKKALQHLWQTQRPDGAWDWLNFGLEPFETTDAAYFGATLAALAIGIGPGSSPGADATRLAPDETNTGIEKLRRYLKTQFASQSLFNRTWLLLASTHFKDLLTETQRQALIKEIVGRQQKDGGWALESLGPWKWSKPAAPFAAPGTRDVPLLAQSDGYATGLIVYTLRQPGLTLSHPEVSKGLQWLKSNQRDLQVKDLKGPAWRAHSLNYDREHGGDKGEPWRRMFMSDLATAFAVLALDGSD